MVLHSYGCNTEDAGTVVVWRGHEERCFVTGLLLSDEDSRAKPPLLGCFVGTVWEGKEDPGGDLIQVSLLAPVVLLDLVWRER